MTGARSPRARPDASRSNPTHRPSMSTITRRRAPRPVQTPQDLSPQVELWLLRLLVPLGGHKGFIQRSGFSDDRLADVLGLEEWTEPESGMLDTSAVRKKLRKLHATAESRRGEAAVSACLRANIARLAELAGLSATDCKILEFVVMLKNERLIDDTADLLGSLSSGKLFYVLSVLLDEPEPRIRAALGTRGVLAHSGLVSVDRSCAALLNVKLQLLSDTFADHIVTSDTDPVELLRDTVAPASSPQLELDDYRHIDASLAVLKRYLRHALAGGRDGVNVFVHGAPGTGKSELAKALAAHLECELFEVASEDADGDPINGERRLRAFRAAQSFLGQRRALILFDEAEDVFNDGDRQFGRKSTAQTRKAWINRTLEANRVPTLWLSNSVECLDAAFIRRFDMVIELPVPPRSQRAKIIANACDGLLDARSVDLMAASAHLAPAIVTRAAAVVHAIRDELDAHEAAAAMKRLIDSTLKAQGHSPISRADPGGLPETYDPAFIHANADLDQIANGVLRARSARLCLYGPPGTGKTAFGRWLARQLGVPLVARRASDLMSMWLGESEKNIADAFQQAERDGALLMIDEVDGFLQDRRGATRSWEVTQVNEMLTQMETFPGVFVASTNLMDGLDQAALRRFDLKVKFDYLLPAQAWALLCRHCGAAGLPAPGAELGARLARLRALTPGDFALVARQHAFRALASPADFVAALEAECALKDGPRSGPGFL
jgi:transitional endoplasmic reticulum ATPase